MEKLKELLKKLEESRFAPFLQFIKFGLVGVSNTAIHYSIEMLCYYVLFANVSWHENVRIAITSALAFIVSVTNAYFWNNRYVFAGGSKTKKPWKQHVITYLKNVLCYGVTGLILAPLLKMLFSGFGIPYWLASLCSMVITIPLNFVLSKFWTFK